MVTKIRGCPEKVVYRMKAWLQRFMSGRYGFDRFSGFLSVTSLVLVVLGALFSPLLYWLGLILLIYCYFRMLSRNIQKRYQENMKFLALESKVSGWFATRKTRFQQRKQYHYYRCPQCHQQLRVPRGRGKISITCPKCGTQFIKKS